MNKPTKFETDLFEKCFKKWGVQSQSIMLIEECSELIKATTKIFRKGLEPKQLDNFFEELADVQLMIDEFIWFFASENYIEFNRTAKKQRVEKLLEA